MAAARIVIVQSGAAGAPATSRDDIVLGVPVTLRNSDDNGVTSWRWRFVSRPIGSTAVLSSPVSANPQFTPDVAGSYLVELAVNTGLTGEVDRRIVAIRETVGVITDLRMPAASEKDEANWDGNELGWYPDLTAWLRASASAATDHGALTGLSDDDHAQYLRTDGTRQLSGNWVAGASNRSISGLNDVGAVSGTFSGNVSLTGASPVATIGGGAGSPELRLSKSDAGTAQVGLAVGANVRASIHLDATENLLLRAHDAAGAVTRTTTYENSTGRWFFPASTFAGGLASIGGGATPSGATPSPINQVGTTTAAQTIGHQLYSNEGSRNTRVSFFLTDAAASAGAWGHWLSFGSGGFQPYVVGMSSVTHLRLSAHGDGVSSHLVGAPGSAATSTGQALLIAGGVGGATSGNGGPLTTRGGAAPTSGTGGAATHTTGDGAGGNNIAGVMTITVGASLGSGTAPAINITGGRSVTGVGSAINITSGQGGSTSGNSGNITIATGAVTSAGASGSVIITTANAVDGNRNAGAFSVTLGNSSGANNGAAITLIAGGSGPTASSSAGGDAILQGGPGIGTGNVAGAAWLMGGIPAEGNGGTVAAVAADGVGTNRNGGNAVIIAGARSDAGGTHGTLELQVAGGVPHIVLSHDGSAPTFGAFGATPVVQPTVGGPLNVGVDTLATTQTRVNQIRQALIDLGLVG